MQYLFAGLVVGDFLFHSNSYSDFVLVLTLYPNESIMTELWRLAISQLTWVTSPECRSAFPATRPLITTRPWRDLRTRTRHAVKMADNEGGKRGVSSGNTCQPQSHVWRDAVRTCTIAFFGPITSLWCRCEHLAVAESTWIMLFYKQNMKLWCCKWLSENNRKK